MPRLIGADGAPGLTLAIEELWPRADRQHCTVHRLRNLLAKLPVRARPDPLQLLVSAQRGDWVKHGKLRLQVLQRKGTRPRPGKTPAFVRRRRTMGRVPRVGVGAGRMERL